ncbi:MFS transporter [Nocardia miyunensis]|uniref:MFS transporter n=1 Tax=Nocardia miyunensis TaxID=282684 RepID=UPI000830F4B2|nr:MFS transporter [Nocardia miyunensis]
MTTAPESGGEVAVSERRDTGERAFGPRFATPLFMGAALNPINSSLIATALVPIALALHVSAGRTTVLISSLYLTSAIAQPICGRLSEIFGPRRVFLAGIAIVFAAGVLGGLAQNMPTLVVTRVLIGLGTSAGYPSAMLLIRRRAATVGLRQPPGRVIAGMTTTSAATLAIGPTVGGMLVAWFDWRAVFWVNVPVAVIAFVMALLWIAQDSDPVRGHSMRSLIIQVDLAGVLLFGGTITALLVFLMDLPRLDWVALGITVVATGVLVAVELRVREPFFDLRLLVTRLPLTRTYARYCLTLLGIYVVLYGLTQWLQVGHRMSAYQAGLVLIPMGLLSAVTGRMVGRYRRLLPSLIISSAALLLGAIGTFFLTSHSPMWLVVVVTAVFGLVAGFGNVTNQTVLYKEAPAEKVGTASGLLRTFGYVGSIAAATISGIAFHTRVDDSGLHMVAAILIGIGIVVLLMTVLDRQLAESDRQSLA